MKNYITGIFARMDLQQLRAFLLYGTSESVSENEDYDAQLKRAADPIYNRINELYPNNPSELTEATNELSKALSTHDEVYMEIGMKAGARLIYQLLWADNPTPPTQE